MKTFERLIVRTLEKQSTNAYPPLDAVDASGDGHEPKRGEPYLGGRSRSTPPVDTLKAVTRTSARRQVRDIVVAITDRQRLRWCYA